MITKKRYINNKQNPSILLHKKYAKQKVYFSISDELILIKIKCNTSDHLPYSELCTLSGRLYLGDYIPYIDWLLNNEYYFINYIDEHTITITLKKITKDPADVGLYNIAKNFDNNLDKVFKIDILSCGKVTFPKPFIDYLNINKQTLLLTTVNKYNDYICLAIEEVDKNIANIPTSTNVLKQYNDYVYCIDGLQYISGFSSHYKLFKPYSISSNNNTPVMCRLNLDTKSISLYLSIPDYNNFDEISHLFTKRKENDKNKNEETLLKVLKISGNSISYNLHTSIISDYKPTWIYSANNKIILSKYYPSDLSSAGICQLSKRYGEKNKRCSNRLSLLSCIEGSNIKEHDFVTLVQHNEDIIIRKSTDYEIQKYSLLKGQKIIRARDGEIRHKSLYFSKETKELLGITKGCWLSIKINIVDGCWLELKSLDDYSRLKMLSEYTKKEIQEHLKGTFKYKTKFVDAVQIPSFFMNEAIIHKCLPDSIQLPYSIDVVNNVFVLEGSPLICDCCGEKISRGK